MNLEEKYPGTEEAGRKLLKQMLEFHPNKRISAAEAIKDPYFDDIRIEEQEHIEPPEITLEFDDIELSIEELREWVVKDIKTSSELEII